MDKYDEAIEYLTENPKEIRKAWLNPDFEDGGCLFQFCKRNESGQDESGFCYGCLTQIRSRPDMVAQTAKLTDLIRLDTRIPTDQLLITVYDLPVFAEWQRRLDTELQRN